MNIEQFINYKYIIRISINIFQFKFIIEQLTFRLPAQY